MILCMDIHFLIYSFLDPKNKWIMSHICKEFDKLIVKETLMIEKLLKPYSYCFEYDDIFKKHFCQNIFYDHLLIDQYFITKCANESDVSN